MLRDDINNISKKQNIAGVGKISCMTSMVAALRVSVGAVTHAVATR